MATKTEKKLVDLTEDVLDAIATYGIDIAWKDGMLVATGADDNPPGSRLVAVDDNGYPVINGVNKKLVELQNMFRLVRAKKRYIRTLDEWQKLQKASGF